MIFPFPFPCFVFSSLCLRFPLSLSLPFSSAQLTISFLVFSHSLSFTLSRFTIYFSCITGCPGRTTPPTPPHDRGNIYRFCALVCHLVSRQRQIYSQTDRSTTCSSIHFCPGALRLRCTTCQPAVFLREEKKRKGNE